MLLTYKNRGFNSLIEQGDFSTSTVSHNIIINNLSYKK